MKRLLIIVFVMAMLLSLTSCVTIVRQGDESSEWEEESKGKYVYLTVRPKDKGITPTADQLYVIKAVIAIRMDNKSITDYEASVDIEQGLVEFSLPWTNTEAEFKRIADEICRTGEVLFRIGSVGDTYGQPTGAVILDSSGIASATASYMPTGVDGTEVESVVALTMTESGKAAFAAATEQQAAIMGTISIWVDGQMVSNPTVYDKITGGEAIINGMASHEEAEELANLITTGALPFDLAVTVDFDNVK